MWMGDGVWRSAGGYGTCHVDAARLGTRDCSGRRVAGGRCCLHVGLSAVPMPASCEAAALLRGERRRGGSGPS